MSGMRKGEHDAALFGWMSDNGDPDYYFGLETLTQAFPDAKVVASGPTVAHINETKDAKLAFWGPQMGADVPSQLIVPEVMEGNTLSLEGQELDVMGLSGRQPQRSYVWIPSLKAVVGGVVVADNLHVWMADTQTPQSHRQWLATLKRIESLQPDIVVPGHYLGENDRSLNSVHFTRDYIKAFDDRNDFKFYCITVTFGVVPMRQRIEVVVNHF